MDHKLKKILFLTVLVLLAPVVFFGADFAAGEYLRISRTEADLEKKKDIGPGEALVLEFSRPVLFPEKISGIKTEPEEKIKISWSGGGRKMLIFPEKHWNPGGEYKLVFPGARNVFLAKINPAAFDFSIVKYPEIFGVYPKEGQKDVALDIEDPIVVDFDKSTRGFFIKFVLDPDPELSYFNNSEKTQFKLMPKTKLEEGTAYALKIYAKYEKAADSDYKLIYQGSFETLPPLPLNWEKDFTARLAQARRFIRPKITSGKYIDLNLSQQIMSIFENGTLLDAYLISSGKRGMETPRGEHKIYNKARRPWSKKYSLYMPFWMAITPSGSYGIHELPEWPGGYKEGKNHLGTPVSHGCVRLGVGPAEKIWNWVDIGTPVVVY